MIAQALRGAWAYAMALLIFSSQITLAADVTSTSGVLAYVIDDSCPYGWADLSYDGTYMGRLIKGWNSNSNLGWQSGNAISNNDLPAHVHGSWSRKMSFQDSDRNSWLINNDERMTDDGWDFYFNQDNSAMDWRNPNIQRVTLRLCHYNNGPTFNLPVGFVVHIHHSKTLCPGGFSDFSDGHGRFLVFATSGKNMGSELLSGAPPVTGNQDVVGWHTHDMPAQWIGMKERIAALTYGGWGPYAAQWRDQRLLEGGTASSNHLNIPYVQLRTCRASTTTTTLALPSSRTIFFYDGQTCPSLWRETTSRSDTSTNGNPFSNIAGRMIFNLWGSSLYAGTINGGGEQLYCATGSCGSYGHGTHVHNYGGSFNLRAQKSGGSWDWGLTHWTDYRSYSWYFDTSGSSASLFPYRVLRACSPQQETKSPTFAPTKSPTSSKPTISPTTSFPTRNPTGSPTFSAPTKNPTVRPSMNPTLSAPTLNPTTGEPTTSPTTSRPSKNPSARPTWSPTPSPVWRDVCEPSDLEKFVNYDNYVIQAGQCWSTCRVSILGSDTTKAKECIDSCATLSGYTPLCRDCMSFWIMTQDVKCRGPCLSSKYSTDCATCTNQYARPDFKICTGFQAADITAGGGDGGANAPRDQGINPGIISGAALGGLFAIAGVVFVARKVRDRMLLDEHLTKEMELALFKGNPDDAPTRDRPKKGFITMFKSSPTPTNNRNSGKNNSLVAAEDHRESTDNPTFATAQQKKDPNMVSVHGVRLRTRYSFHGTEQDELDVAAGTALVAIEKNDDWYVCQDEKTGKYGLIPAGYVSTV